MRALLQITFIGVLTCSVFDTTAQSKHALPVPIHKGDTTAYHPDDSEDPNKETDLIDVVESVVKKHYHKRVDTNEQKTTKLHLSAVPAAGYTLQTGFAALIAANAVFYTAAEPAEKESAITTNITYSQYKQILFPMQSTIWTKDNKYNITTDWRYLKYPSLTYGLGMNTSLDDGYTIDYSALKFHQTLSRKVTDALYLGVGYDFDYFWNIKEVDPPATAQTDFQKYGLSKTELASGITLNFLYDKRPNPINPDKGAFANIIYRPNFTFLGSDNNWSSLVFDLRKYFKFPGSSRNVLAFWNYDWLTVAGKPPYLLLPNTGSDPYSNTGRGYIQGRYRDQNMIYFEGEYRFVISHNGLFGGVIFANAQSFSSTTNFTTIAPGYGAGLRIKLNKFSKTNLGVDYGIGIGGSRGFFVNLGEVF